MKFKYTLERSNSFQEDVENNSKIVEYIKKDIERKKKNKFIEQDLGTLPIPIKEFLYQTLKI